MFVKSKLISDFHVLKIYKTLIEKRIKEKNNQLNSKLLDFESVYEIKSASTIRTDYDSDL